MRTPGKKVTRLVTWTLSGSILTSSCTNPNTDISDIEETLPVQHIDKGLSAIRINMNSAQLKYIEKLSRLSDRLVKDRDFAKRFANNPNRYMKNNLFAGSIIFSKSEDKSLMNIVKALADDEIASAIKSNDIKRYLLLMYKKGFLEETAKINDYVNLIPPEEKKQLLKSIGVKMNRSQEYDGEAIAAVVFVFYAAVIAVSWVSAAYSVAAAVNMGVSITVLAHAAAVTKTKVKVSGYVEEVQLSSNFDVWMLSSSNEAKEMMFGNENINKTIREAVEAYSEIFVEEAKLMDLKQFAQAISLNLSKQQIISNNMIILEK